MPKLTVRRGVWTVVAVLGIVVLGGSAYLLAHKHPEPPASVPATDPHGLVAEEERAKKLPEYAELKKLLELRPLTQEALTRAGELAGHPNWVIRVRAVRLLGSATGPLQANASALVVPRLKDEALFVRVSAMDALARLGAKERIPELVAFVSSPDRDERTCAKRALKQLGHAVD